jgi:CheY-like chemotaxis protein
MNFTRIIEKVLIVDDDPVSNHLATELIKKLGFAKEIVTRQNGKEGIKYLKPECAMPDTCPSLILLDIKMPVMDGFDFLKEFEKLKISKEDIFIAIITSSTNPDDIIKLRNTGSHYLIRKPLSIDKMVDIYHRFFRNSED